MNDVRLLGPFTVWTGEERAARSAEDSLRIRGVILRLQDWLDGHEEDSLIKAPLLDIAQASLDMVIYAQRRARCPAHVVSDDDPS